jgi:hypothetical protein
MYKCSICCGSYSSIHTIPQDYIEQQGPYQPKLGKSACSNCFPKIIEFIDKQVFTFKKYCHAFCKTSFSFQLMSLYG